MKTVTYNLKGGGKKTIEYDETAPCVVCGEPVGSASMGGTAICPACDCGVCRYCGVQLPMEGKAIKQHIAWHKLAERGKLEKLIDS